MKFYIPPTLEQDFIDWLNTDVPNINYDFELVRDWYARSQEGYEPVSLRAMLFSIEWKSKVGNSDANSNFKTSYAVPIRKGDIVIRADGSIFMLNWTVQRHPNNQSTQAIDCNARLEFTRHVDEKLDARGYLLEEAHDAVVAPAIPCVFSEYTGRPDYAASYNTPGISADHLLNVQVQYNPTTKAIRVGDDFMLYGHRYRVVNWVGTEIDMTASYGIINLMARKAAGGEAE